MTTPNDAPLSDDSTTPAESANSVATAAELGEKPTNVRWLMFVLACGTSFFLYLHRYTWNFIGVYLEKDYGFSNTALGALGSFFSPTYGFGQIPSGVLCDFMGPHFFLGLIIVIWSLVLPYFGLPTNYASLAGFRLLFGAAQSGAYPSLSRVTHSWFPAKSRTIVQGWIATFSGRGGGAMSSILLGTVLIGYCELPWRTALVVMGLSGLAFVIAFLLLFRNTPEEHPRVNAAECALIHEGEVTASDDAPRVLPWRRVVRSRSMRFFVLQQVMSAGADGVYVFFMGAYFMNAKGFDIINAGWLVSLPLWGGAIGGMIGGYCNDFLIRVTGSRRWSRSSVGFVGKALACGLMFVAIAQNDGVTAAWALFVVKFFSDWSQPTVWGTCTDMGGRYSASVFGVINTAGTVGGLISPTLFGAILDYNTTKAVVDGVKVATTNYSPLFTVIAIMYMISAVCWFFIDSTQSLEIDLEPAV
jgi:sugar phosphate permease